MSRTSIGRFRPMRPSSTIRPVRMDGYRVKSEEMKIAASTTIICFQ